MGRKKKLENQTEVIVEAARQLFGQYGFAKTTLDDIAREIGIGKATLYSDFASKEEILQAVIQKIQSEALDNMRRIVKKSKAGPLKTLHEVLLQDVMTVFDNLKKHFQDADPSDPPPLVRGRMANTSFLKTSLDEKVRIMADLLEEAAEKGLIEPLTDSLAQARMLRMSLMSIKPPMMGSRKDSEVRNFVSELIDIMLSGLKLPRNTLDTPRQEID